MTIGRKTGGRKPGSKNVVTERVRLDVLAVYRKLGGTKWLLEWAKSNPNEFVKNCLTRLLPPPPRDDPEPSVPSPANTLTDLEAAKRIAFALSKVAYSLDIPPREQPKTIEALPLDAVPVLAQPTKDVPDTLEISTGSSTVQSHRRNLL